MSRNQNGQLLLHILGQIKSASAAKIQKTIANMMNVRPADIAHVVQETLNGGVHYGYIQKHGDKYFVKSEIAIPKAPAVEECTDAELAALPLDECNNNPETELCSISYHKPLSCEVSEYGLDESSSTDFNDIQLRSPAARRNVNQRRSSNGNRGGARFRSRSRPRRSRSSSPRQH